MKKFKLPEGNGKNYPLQPRRALIAGFASVITVAVLIALKLTVYLQSGAASVLASLLDSVIDAKVSLMTLLAIHYSLKPADDEHRYGHGKIEGVAALFQAAFIAGAGLFLVLESLSRFGSPTLVENHMAVISVMAVTTLLSLILVAIQNYSLKRAPSLSVEADKAHYSTDIAINVGVIVVMVALQYGAPPWIDPLYAAGVGIYLAFTVRVIAGKALDMLLDRELPADTRGVITAIILSSPGVRGMHDLRTSKSGMEIFISFDIEVDPDLSLHAAHEIARQVESDLMARFPNAEVMIHVDPSSDTEDARHRVAGVHDR